MRRGILMYYICWWL